MALAADVLALLNYTDLSVDKKPLGQGKFGKVYKASCKKLNEDVAVKIITDKETFKKDEIDEIGTLLKGLAHVNIVSIKAVIRPTPELEGEGYWIVMEFCDYNLQQIRDKIPDKQIPWARWTFLIKGILAGLIYLHEKETIHCDLKPENVLVNDRFQAKIADVGLSRIAGELYTACENQTLLLPSGTLQYISPERLRDPYKAPQFTDDCYSCGLLIYKMITNADLFELKDYYDEESRIRDMKVWLCESQYRHSLDVLKDFSTPPEIDTAIQILWNRDHDSRSADKALDIVTEAVTKHRFRRKEALEEADKILKILIDDDRINQPEALLTDQDLSKIANGIGPEWREIGLSLGLSNTQLYRCEADNPHSVHDKIFAMLHKWKLKEQRNATRSVLINKLAATDSVDLSAFDFMPKT